MVNAVSPVILLANVPAPVPSEVLVVRAIVGPDVVPQHTPRAVTVAPPSEVMFPPPVAVVVVMALAAVVLSVGNTGFAPVVKFISFPYTVFTKLVA